MKRVWRVLGLVAITALVTYLAVTKYLAEERAQRLDRALMDAEARLVQLQSDIEAAQQRLAELTRAHEYGRAQGAGSRRPNLPTSEAAASQGAAQSSPSTDSKGLKASEAGPASVVQAMELSWVRYTATAGLTNQVRIEGTSSIHDWQVEGRLIGGSGDFGPGLPMQAGVRPALGGVDARVNVFIPVRSLKSVQSDGSPYSDTMDEVMYGKLGEKAITYKLTSITSQQDPEDMVAPFSYEATGQLSVAGVTNTITMPVSILPVTGGKVQFSGSVRIRMSDFKISPPSPSFGGVAIKTGDEVKVSFNWWLKRVGPLGLAK